MDLSAVNENRVIGRWVDIFSRCPEQLNGPHESDCELVPFPGSSAVMALTTDTVAEEIDLGFYDDPEAIGWMAATVSLSDLAAVGAEPLGLLVSVSLPCDYSAELQQRIARGIEAACVEAGTFVLGGDTNNSAQLSITTTAVGVISRARVVLRTGSRVGDALFATGTLGGGAIAAARGLLDGDDPFRNCQIRPRARVREGRVLSAYASACIDTSDGLIAALDQLARLNRVGFEVSKDLRGVIHPQALALSDRLGVDPLNMLAQPHGEFELLYTVSPERIMAFEDAARQNGISLLYLGRTVSDGGIRIGGRHMSLLDTAAIRNLPETTGRSTRCFFDSLLSLISELPVLSSRQEVRHGLVP
jgi:thiamine-monophosphate kinase